MAEHGTTIVSTVPADSMVFHPLYNRESMHYILLQVTEDYGISALSAEGSIQREPSVFK